MNTAIYTQSSGSEGVGFAMPSNTIIIVYNMLIGPDHKVTEAPSASPSSRARRVSRAIRLRQWRCLRRGGPPCRRPRRQGWCQARRHHRFHRRQARQGRRRSGSRHLIPPGRLQLSLASCVMAPSRRSPLLSPTAAKLFADVGNNSDNNSAPSGADASESKLGLAVDRGPRRDLQQARHPRRSHRHQCPAWLLRGRYRNFTLEPSSSRSTRSPSPMRPISLPSSMALKSGKDVVFKVRLPRSECAERSILLGGTLP